MQTTSIVPNRRAQQCVIGKPDAYKTGRINQLETEGQGSPIIPTHFVYLHAFPISCVHEVNWELPDFVISKLGLMSIRGLCYVHYIAKRIMCTLNALLKPLSHICDILTRSILRHENLRQSWISVPRSVLLRNHSRVFLVDRVKKS
jgi:hypothetical protein